jgi:hypothetical protein
VTALQGTIAARGGTVTHNKPELLEIVAAMKDIEDEHDPMTVDTKNGLTLPNLSTKSNVKPRVEIAKLSELDEIKNDVELHKLCKDTEELCNAGKVMEDMDLLASKSAVMTTEFVKFHFATLGHVGQVTEDKKSVRDSKSKSMEQISNTAAPHRHHSCAVKDASTHFLITTQSASLGKDHGSKKKQNSQEPQQQQADPKQCIHLVEFSAMPTSATDGDDHDFGVINAVPRRWCACKAGNGANNGKCMHDGMAFHDQIRIFAADYQGNDSATAGTKKWKHRGADRPRTCDPVHRSSSSARLDDSSSIVAHRCLSALSVTTISFSAKATAFSTSFSARRSLNLWVAERSFSETNFLVS